MLSLSTFGDVRGTLVVINVVAVVVVIAVVVVVVVVVVDTVVVVVVVVVVAVVVVVGVDVGDDFVADIVGSVDVVAKTSLTSKLKLGILMLTKPFISIGPSVVIDAAAVVGVVVVIVIFGVGMSTPTKPLVFIGFVIVFDIGFTVVVATSMLSLKLKLGSLMPTKPLISIRLSVVVVAFALVVVVFVADIGVGVDFVVAGTSFFPNLKLGIFMFTKPLILTGFFVSSFSMVRSGGSPLPGVDIMIQDNIGVDLKTCKLTWN